MSITESSTQISDTRNRKRNVRARYRIANRVVYHICMLTFAAIFLLPFYWMAISAFKNNAEIFANPMTWWPDPFRWSNVEQLLNRGDEFPFVKQFLNSCFYAGMVATGICLSSSLIAYSFACLRWKGRDIFFAMTIAAMLLPPVITFLPTYFAWTRLGFANSYVPLITPFFFGDAFFIFMLRQFFLGIPRELLDAARLDGASEFRIWWQIAIPQVKTALVIVALFSIVYTWNEFFNALVYLRDREDLPLSVGLFAFRAQRTTEWSVIMAGALFTALPMVILFLFTQRLFQHGLATSSLK